MFDFKKKILSPVVTDVSNQIDGALKSQSVTDKIEQLLSIKDAAHEKLRKIAEREARRAAAVFGAGGGVAIGGSLFVFLFMLPVIPAAAFTCFALASGAVALKIVENAERVSDADKRLGQKIGDEVLSLVKAAPQDAVKSARFMNAVAQAFNGSASANEAAFASSAFHARPLSSSQPKVS